MKSPWLKALPFLLVAMLLTGCATNVPALASITMTLTGVKTEGGRTVATVRYLNESVISIGLSGTRHKIYLNGNLLGTAIYQDAVGLASNIPVVLDLPLSDGAGSGLPSGGASSYRMENRLTVMVGDRRVHSDSESTGSLTLR